MNTKTPAADSARVRDTAKLLPAIGLFLLMPPVITLFAVSSDVAGVPLIVVYIFGVWLALIVCAALVARRLASAPSEIVGTQERDR
jgi:hypothetical protein